MKFALAHRAVCVALIFGQSAMVGAVHAQGFFGGIKFSEPRADGGVVAGDGLGLKVPIWERQRNLQTSEQTSVFGGVNVGSVGVGAAMSQTRPYVGHYQNANVLATPTNPGNVGLDLYSAFTVTKGVTVFGRVGYERNELRPLGSTEANMISPLGSTTLKSGTSMNYGLGLRFDVSPTLGVRAEYTRGTRFGLDRPELSREAEPDSISLGVRLKF